MSRNKRGKIGTIISAKVSERKKSPLSSTKVEVAFSYENSISGFTVSNGWPRNESLPYPKGGRAKATSTIRPGDLARARALYAARENTVAEIMQLTGFKNRSTFYNYVVNAEKKMCW